MKILQYIALGLIFFFSKFLIPCLRDTILPVIVGAGFFHFVYGFQFFPAMIFCFIIAGILWFFIFLE